MGATTLMDFEPGGVGGELLGAIGLAFSSGEALPGYVAWLPDRTVTLHLDHDAWAAERLAAFGATSAHYRFWAVLDRLADVFWRVARRGVKLAFRAPVDLWRADRVICKVAGEEKRTRAVSPPSCPYIRYL